MINLIVRRLEQTNPELVPASAKTVDAIRHAHVPAEYKRDLLELAWRKAGPEMVLSIGQGARGGGNDPLWHAATRAASPTLLLDQWQRFEVFAHSQNRLRIDRAHEKRVSFQRYTVDGSMPTTPENIMVCGLIIALLEEIGCHDLRCEMSLVGGSAFYIRENGHFHMPDDPDTLVTTAWTIEWQTFSPRAAPAKSSAEPLHIDLPQPCEPALREMIEAVVRLLTRDATRQWKVSELAREAGLSTRSLQRRLDDAGLNFSSLVRLVRIHEACRLLEESNAPLTTIGFCSGFSDSAHFSRDFRASMGLTPSDYRALC